MEVLLALVSAPLTKALEITFLTGFATAYKLESLTSLRGGLTGLPGWERKKRQKLRQKGSAKLLRGGSGSLNAKSLPNDPERQGNIWHRYEQLENATRSLSIVNQQLIDERLHHKKERKRLEDTIAELRLQATATLAPPEYTPGFAYEAAPVRVRPLSAESKAVMQELDSPSAVKEMRAELADSRMELQRLTEELSNAHNQLEFLRSENQDLQADNMMLQRRNETGGSSRRRRDRSVDKGATPQSPFHGSGSVGAFANEVASRAAGVRMAPQLSTHTQASLTSFGSDIEMNSNLLMSTQSSELDRAANAIGGAEYPSTEFSQVTALKQEVHILKDRLARAETGTVSGVFAADPTRLQEKLKRLQEENQRLQNKVLRLDQEPARDQDLEERYSRLLEENTRLQGKIVRLNLGASTFDEPDSSLSGDLKNLRAENAELREDNDKLLSYLDNLAEEKKQLEIAAQGAVDLQPSSRQVQELMSENQSLKAEVYRMRGEGTDPSSARSQVKVPVAVETGEEMDKDLWMLVEELRDQNRGLIQELDKLQGAPPQAQIPQQENVSQRIAELEQQLASERERQSADKNDGNTKLVTILADENANLQQENMRLTKALVAGAATADGEVMQELINSNERLILEKQRAIMQCRSLTEKYARLVAENEVMMTQARPAEQPLAKADSFKGGPASKGLMGRFTKSLRKKNSRDGRESSDSDLHLVSKEGSAQSLGSKTGSLSLRGGESPPRELVQELIDENTRLFEDNQKLKASTSNLKELADANQKLQEEKDKLQAGMGLVKELSEENSKLVQENKQLSDRLNASLTENRDLSARLIDEALQNEEAMFDAAFGEPQPQASAQADKHFSPSTAEQRQGEIAEQVRIAEEQSKQHQARRDDLNARTTNQLEAYEKASGGSQNAYKKSAANAMARLSSLSQRASINREESESVAHQQQSSLQPQPSFERSLEFSEDPALEAERRQQEAQQARLELDRKIQASRARRNTEGSHPGSPVTALLPELTRPDTSETAERRVQQAYITYCRHDDLGGFMASLGYSDFERLAGRHDDAKIIDIFQKATSVTSEIQMSAAFPPESQTLAKMTHAYLQDWYQQYTSG